MLLNLVLPVFIGFILIVALIKKVNILDCFVEGVKDGFDTVKRILPILMLMLTAIFTFRESGILSLIIAFTAPAARFIGIPSEVLPLVLLRPMSGSGSLAVLENIISVYGVDSYIGKVAAVMTAATETTFYTISIYLGGLTKKCGKLIACALLADLVSSILSAATVRLFIP